MPQTNAKIPPGALGPLIDPEPALDRWFYSILAILLALGFWFATQCYFVPVTYGGDRNGYLMGGRMLAARQFRGIKPVDPFVFLGPHWVMIKPGRFALKYPLGLPSLYAIVHWLAGPANWAQAAHYLSPLAATLGVFGSFLLFRAVVGSFAAILGMILLATSPVTFFYANTPNSHATALCVAVWGMFLLLRWWQSGGAWRAIAAGLLLGFNFTVRYTEGLLLMPLLTAMILSLRAGGRPAWRQARLLPIAWLIPVLILVLFNLIALHHATGYSLTNESTAFSLSNFLHNWHNTLRQLNGTALFFILPLALLGSILSFAWNWRVALLLWSWVIGPLLVYTAYYWSPDEEGSLGFTRFFLTILPALVLAAVWLLRQMSRSIRIVGPIAAGAIVAISLCANLSLAVERSDEAHWDNLACMVLEHQVLTCLPAGSVVFAQDRNIVPLEVAGDYRFYQSELFTRDYVQGQAHIDPDSPQILQPQRAKALYDLLGGLSDAQLADRQNELMRQLLGEGRKIYVVLPRALAKDFCRRFVDGRGFDSVMIDQWEIDGLWRGDAPQATKVQMEILQIESAG